MTKGEAGLLFVFATSIANMTIMALCWGFIVSNILYALFTGTDGYYPLHWITAVGLTVFPSLTNSIWLYLFSDYTDAFKKTTSGTGKEG